MIRRTKSTSGGQAPELIGEQRGVGEHRLVATFIEQIDAGSGWKNRACPGALAHPAHAEQEEGLFRGTGDTLVDLAHIDVNTP